MTDTPEDTGFYDWWQQHYSMANLAMGAAEDAWNAATAKERERRAKPVAYAYVLDGECDEIGWGEPPLEDPSLVLLYRKPTP